MEDAEAKEILNPFPGEDDESRMGNVFGFKGLPHDPETGFIYTRNRYYDPELGRFLTTDPVGYADGPLNNSHPYAHGFSARNVNPRRSKTNCVACVIAMDSTLAGRPMIAEISGTKPASFLAEYYGKKIQWNLTIDDIVRIIKDKGRGSRGIVFGNRAFEAEHVFTVANQRDVVRFIDAHRGGAAVLNGRGYVSFGLLLTHGDK